MKSEPARRRSASSSWLLPALAFCLLHAALVAFDIANPGAILRGDRTEGRWEKIESVLSAESAHLASAVAKNGPPGDYLIHAALYGAGGNLAIILVQVTAAFLTLLTTMRLTRELRAPPIGVALSGLLFVLLPASIMGPHLLVTETLYTTSFTLGVLALAIAAARNSVKWMWIAVMPMALAAFVRPQGIIFLPIAAMLMAASRPRAILSLTAPAMMCLLLFPGLWFAWRLTHGGDFGLGQSDGDLQINFRIRAQRALALAGAADWNESQFGARIGWREFVDLVAQYPQAFVRTYLTDAMNLALNPGANAVFGHYLQMLHTSADTHYWKLLMDREGLAGVVVEVARNGSGFVAAFVFCAAVHVVTTLSAIIGVYLCVRDRRTRAAALMVTMMTLATCAILFLSGLIRWSHRAPIEPLMAAFAGVGLAWIVQSWRDRNAARGDPALSGEPVLRGP